LPTGSGIVAGIGNFVIDAPITGHAIKTPISFASTIAGTATGTSTATGGCPCLLHKTSNKKRYCQRVIQSIGCQVSIGVACSMFIAHISNSPSVTAVGIIGMLMKKWMYGWNIQNGTGIVRILAGCRSSIVAVAVVVVVVVITIIARTGIVNGGHGPRWMFGRGRREQ